MRKLLSMVVTLTLITAVCGFLLGAINGVTAEQVRVNQQAKQIEAAKRIFEDAAAGEPLRFGSWVGYEVERRDGRLTIAEVPPVEGPMSDWRGRVRRMRGQALLPGDQILALDGDDASDLTADEAESALAAARQIRVRTEDGRELELSPNPRHGSLLYPITGGGEVIGVAFETRATGFGGPIGVLAGFDLSDDSLVGVEITDLSETPGVGSRAKSEPWFLAQFGLRSGATSFLVKQDGGQIDAISGATVTSRAVSAAVTQAVGFYRDNREAIRRLVRAGTGGER